MAKYRKFIPAVAQKTVAGFPKIYLAGKIRKNCWRHGIVSSLDRAIDFHTCGDEPPYEWPVLSKAILGTFDYTGPFFIGCDHGCFHGDGSHGYSSTYDIDSDGDGHLDYVASIGDPGKVVNLCLDAVRKCDTVFAWVDAEGAYGTAVELGYAKALGKEIVVASNNWPVDMWFAKEMADVVIQSESACSAFSKFAERYLNAKMEFESPVEEMFYKAWQGMGGSKYLDLTYQHEVFNALYRLDFAYLPAKVAIEIDGHEYHSGKEQFTKDRQRQRKLEMDGWRFIRFSGSEVFSNASSCVVQAHDFIKTIGGK